jgi:hypothetical protein
LIDTDRIAPVTVNDRHGSARRPGRQTGPPHEHLIRAGGWEVNCRVGGRRSP